MKNSFTIVLPISQLLAPMAEENPKEGTQIFDGLITITGECALVSEEGGQYWECQEMTWTVADTTVEVVGNPTFNEIVTGSDSDLDLRAILTGCEAEMLCLLAEAAENDPEYLAHCKERAEAKQRVADARSALAEAEWILRNPPQDVDDEGEAERRFLSRADDAREAAFDANREPWEDPRDLEPWEDPRD
jgi:hypothetical protein